MVKEYELGYLTAPVGLRREKVPRYDVRTFASPEEHDERMAGRERWLDRGTEHVVLAMGGIRRRLADEWEMVAEFADLDAFVVFVEAQGFVTIEAPNGPEALPVLGFGVG